MRVRGWEEREARGRYRIIASSGRHPVARMQPCVGEPGSKRQLSAKHSGSCSPAVLPVRLLGVVV